MEEDPSVLALRLLLNQNSDLWYSPDYGRIFIYYDESEVGYGTDAQWIDAAPFNMPPPDGRNLTIGRRTGAKVISVVGIGLSIFTRAGIGTAKPK